MQLNEIISLEPTVEYLLAMMPYKVKENSLIDEVEKYGLNIESLFSTVPLEVKNRKDVLMNTKGFELLETVKLRHMNELFAIGILTIPENGIMFATLLLSDYREDEYIDKHIPPVSEVCKMFESFKFGTTADVISNLTRFKSLELISENEYNSVINKLKSFAVSNGVNLEVKRKA